MNRAAASDPRWIGAWKVWEVAALASILGLALVLRLVSLGEGLWFDEIKMLVEHVRLPLAELVTTLDSKNRHMLYSLLAKGSIGALGESAASLRLPAALLGTASLWALYVFGRRVTIRREALFAALLLAVSYHHVWFSQNARGYTGLLLFALLASYEFVRMLDPRSAPKYAPLLYGLWVALGMYTHLTGAVVPAAHFLILLWLAFRGGRRSGQIEGPDAAAARSGRRAAALGMVAAAAIAALLYAPVLSQLRSTFLASETGGSLIEWQNPLWAVSEALTVLGRGVPGGALTVSLVMLVPLTGVVSYARSSPLAAAVMVLPAVLTGAAIVLAGQNLWPRFFFFSAGFGALFLMRGLSAIGGLAAGLVGRSTHRTTEALPGGSERTARAARWSTGLAAAAVLASALTVPRAWGPKQDFEGAARWVVEHAEPGDAIIAVDMTSQPYRYLGREWPSAMSLVDLEGEERVGARSWILYTFPPFLQSELPDLWERIESEYETAGEFHGTLSGGVVIVAVRE